LDWFLPERPAFEAVFGFFGGVPFERDGKTLWTLFDLVGYLEAFRNDGEEALKRFLSRKLNSMYL
jgi:hypothetical protein